MILRFPNLDVLTLAITSQTVSEEVLCAPAKVARDGDTVLLKTNSKISRSDLTALKSLGVESMRSAKAEFRGLVSWHQALPIQKSDEDLDLSDKTEVLFEIDTDDQLITVVTEMLRLGNDRQSFRHVVEDKTEKTLLRVTSPPYYTLLRAIDSRSDHNETNRTASVTSTDTGIQAYVQQNSRVWVPVGYRHPLGSRLNPPSGKWLLISRSGLWRFLNEGVFRDVYEALEFNVPGESADFISSDLEKRIPVAMRLIQSTSVDSAELYVLNKDGMQQVETLVRESSDSIVSRLSFAVAPNSEQPDQPTVIIRARPSKQTPPKLILDGTAYKKLLNIGNLFVPVGRRLHPPLRRDAIIELLSRDKKRLSWLAPLEDSDQGAFAPHSIDDNAFRPLSDWIEYVIDHQSVALNKWVQSHEFDFDRFVCNDDTTKKKPKPKKTPVKEPKEASGISGDPGVTKTRNQTKRISKGDQNTEVAFAAPKTDKKKLELQKHLRSLENQFRDSDEPIDAAVRSDLWREMAMANTNLLHRHDATICWANHLWNQPELTEILVQGWVQSEQHCSLSDESFSEERLDTLIQAEGVRSAEPSLVAAYLVWAASCETFPEMLVSRQSKLNQFLERQEEYLPIRAAWLAWCALFKLSGNDVLLLARARDRMLERLFRQSLAPEFDLPAFLRSGTVGAGDRFRALRDHVMSLKDVVANWVVEPQIANNPQTKGYAELVFAFALSRLGESVHCKEVLEQLSKVLQRSDRVHRWVYQAFQLRIQQALQGQGTDGQLSDDLLAELEDMERMDRYKIDRLRQHSRILEPHVRIDPYRNWHKRFNDDLGRDLAMLQNVVDRDTLSKQVLSILRKSKEPKHLARILSAVLPLAPRVGESFAGGLLDRVSTGLANCDDSLHKAMLLQRAIQTAAHFGRINDVQDYVDELTAALPVIVQDYLELETQVTADNKEKSEAIETLLTQSFRGLRKLGMRDAIGSLYGKVASLIDESAKKSRKPARSNKGGDTDASRSQRLLLCVAGGWYYFGDEEGARRIADKVWTTLTSTDLPSVQQKHLACAYLAAVSQAPVDEALQRVTQVFSLDKKGNRCVPGISDNMTTSSHFSISQLDLIESAVMSLISDDFSLNAEARRWLDEDEFLVRSRIHQDVRAATDI